MTTDPPAQYFVCAVTYLGLMGLMTGTGPFSNRPEGTWSFEPPAPGGAWYVEPSPKRVRVVLSGETIADTTHALLLSRSGQQPTYLFPEGDVRMDLLEPSGRHASHETIGEVAYFSIRLPDRIDVDAAWSCREPLDRARPLAGFIAFAFDRMDHWYEEDEEIFAHAKDPYHRIDAYKSSRRVRVSLAGQLLAESERAIALFESNLPVRWYLPADDVLAKLVASDTVTDCGYKGRASYCSVDIDGEVVRDLVWFYTAPLPDGIAVKDLLCFFNERVDIELDDELQPRPQTPWTRGALEGEA